MGSLEEAHKELGIFQWEDKNIFLSAKIEYLVTREHRATIHYFNVDNPLKNLKMEFSGTYKDVMLWLDKNMPDIDDAKSNETK